jgi:hypothetical protein
LDHWKMFNRVTYFEDKKSFFAGTVQTYKIGKPEKLYYGIQFYPQDVIREDTIYDAVMAVRALLGMSDGAMAFVALSSQQTVATVAGKLAAAGIESFTVDTILAGLVYLPMNPGTAYGYLRLVNGEDEAAKLTACDIPVFRELPLDLSVVAGVITVAIQDSGSHVNLKSKERGTPNAVQRDAFKNIDILDRVGKPVKLTVGPERLQIEESTAAAVIKANDKKINTKWIRPPWKPETKLLSYDEMCPDDPAACVSAVARFGAKAGNLGFLANPKVLGRTAQRGSMSYTLGYELVPQGFGIPLQFYSSFINAPENRKLKEMIDQLIEREKSPQPPTPEEQTQLAAAVRQEFYRSTIPANDLAAVHQKIKQVFPAGVAKLKFRSSASTEDIPGFNGAGLHDSFSAKPDENEVPGQPCRFVSDSPTGAGLVKGSMEPKTVSCAMKGVWASLWNKRAIEERNFARYDHAGLAMGIAVVEAYDSSGAEFANSVVVTRVINTDDIYGYTLSIQEGNNTVTNPLPGTNSEVTVAGMVYAADPVSFSVTRFAKPKADGPALTRNILSRPEMSEMVLLAQRIETRWCQTHPDYQKAIGGHCELLTDPRKKLSLDMEFKVLPVGNPHQLLCKQVREFSGR